MKSNEKRRMLGIVTASAVLLMLVVSLTPVSAAVFPDNNETMIKMANGAFYNSSGDDYYFKFTKAGGGLNAIHIADSPASEDRYGGVYTNKGTSGTFYISDTSKDPGCSDSAILMFGVSSDVNTTNLELNVNASGYNWTFTPIIMYPDSVTYYDEVEIGTFDESDFLDIGGSDIESYWRPYFDEDYPMYDGQGNLDTYKVMFIDLSLGTLKYNSSLNYNGSIKVDYDINGFIEDDYALFDIYTWCNQSKQGQGVSWTNKVIGTNSSSWTIGF
jgi:hypothetical protein